MALYPNWFHWDCVTHSENRFMPGKAKSNTGAGLVGGLENLKIFDMVNSDG